ncbi:MAG: sulfide/dihydroorotate dehydrogenase-like FAD/NAD-binding protein [Candidatus Omnitrophica bacterium]|nr:sulfide/dihydroorotate dehydrogenase-like FAD/NAD-binding protein [Candidatus Omnitrophota bacterium]
MKILSKEVISEAKGVRIMRIKISAPQIAAKVKPGQFVVLMVGASGERIPLTVVDRDDEGITLIFQEAGLTSRLLGKVEIGDVLYALAGPLGHPTEIADFGKTILVGGGVGIAEIYPVARACKEKGNHLTVIIGARAKDLLILEKELKALSDEFFVATDDGSYGKKGFTTDILQDLLNQQPTTNDQRLVYAVGPLPMMKRVAAVTRPFGIKTIVSLNALMVDATGMCGCCRVTVAGKTRFSCIDGPEFDAHLVDFDELVKRNRIYEDKEKHICNLHNLS